jgi:hypothetical protein
MNTLLSARTARSRATLTLLMVIGGFVGAMGVGAASASSDSELRTIVVR